MQKSFIKKSPGKSAGDACHPCHAMSFKMGPFKEDLYALNHWANKTYWY